MANYHIMEVSESGKTVRVVMHIPTPAGNNLAGKAYAQAIIEDADASKVSVVPGIGAAEVTALANGTLAEREVNFSTSLGATNAVKQAQLDTLYTFTSAQVQEFIRRRYWAWGLSRNVP